LVGLYKVRYNLKTKYLANGKMISAETEIKLRDFLVAVGDGERAVEAARQKLCLIEDYEPKLAFQRLSQGRDLVGV
jgi:hypothetical protein